MRDLSARLGVSLGATYHHVPSKQVLLQRVAQDLFASVEVPSSATSDWREQVKTLVLTTASAVGQYQGMAAYVLAHVDELGHGRLNQELIAVLRGAGFSERNVHGLMSALYFYGAGISANILPVLGTETFERADMQAMFEDGLDMLLAGAALRLDAPGAEPGSPAP
jgi:AcrR family transcriptional regulator